jgi:hypothetical protein
MSDAGRTPNPTRGASADCPLKLHLRVRAVGGYAYRVLTLRPGTTTAFSTNFFHQTWHIVSSPRGSRLLARLLWGLSYERHPGTVLVVHGEHLLPTPFEAERSDPFLLAPAGLTRLDPGALRLLKGRLSRFGPPDKTVRWQTFGLDRALETRRDGQETRSRLEGECEQVWRRRPLWYHERMERRGGFICYTAPPPLLRLQALRVHGLRVSRRNPAGGMDCHFLAGSRAYGGWADGEVQIFGDYMDRVAAAVEARRELQVPPNQPVLSETVQELISRRRDRIKSGRVAGRRWGAVPRPASQ